VDIMSRRNTKWWTPAAVFLFLTAQASVARAIGGHRGAKADQSSGSRQHRTNVHT